VSYLHAKNPSWTSEKLDKELESIMEKVFMNIEHAAGKYGIKKNGIPDYVVGADIAAFERVVEGIGAEH
jgi:glutamate dehydrogenase (NADP+)